VSYSDDVFSEGCENHSEKKNFVARDESVRGDIRSDRIIVTCSRVVIVSTTRDCI